ncbi:MAG: molybdopterin dinucleotide binding domain-containing protein [Arhodomonas sp.]|nr:molybdopterin dinucleotide binding domain-containing protein [Arhodomonas sp.]
MQDIFLTETAEFADVILPASSFMEKTGTYTNTDRRVQIGRAARSLPGEARQDWEIVCEIATRMGYPMGYDSPGEIFDEIVACSPSYTNLSYEVLGDYGKWYPCPDPAAEGTRVMFAETFPRGRARFVPAEVSEPVDRVSDEYPVVLNSGRLLEHWHTGVMTRRPKALDEIAPEAFVEVHPDDAGAWGLTDGGYARVTSRRGAIVLRVRVADRVARGSVFIPMHFREAGVNTLTGAALDPYGKIPAFKYSAVRPGARRGTGHRRYGDRLSRPLRPPGPGRPR